MADRLWHQAFMRLARREFVSIWWVDTLCVLLNEHIGRFDPVYSAMDSE